MKFCLPNVPDTMVMTALNSYKTQLTIMKQKIVGPKSKVIRKIIPF